MTAVRLGESVRYGVRLYAVVLGITLLGGASVALGAALAWPEVQAWRGPGQASRLTGAAGGVLLFLGLSILVIGYLAVAYKLLADGVAAGRADSVPEMAPDAAEDQNASADSTETAVPGPDPNVGGVGSDPVEESAGEPTAETDAEPEPATETGPAEADEQPPEPSPEEIAFGSSGGDTSTGPDTEPVEESEPSPSGGALPGQNASSDPLADPSDE